MQINNENNCSMRTRGEVCEEREACGETFTSSAAQISAGFKHDSHHFDSHCQQKLKVEFKVVKISIFFRYHMFKMIRYPHSIVLKKKKIRFSTQSCTDMNIISNVLVCAQWL